MKRLRKAFSFDTMRQWSVYLAVRILICVLQSVTIETCERIASFLTWLSYDVLGIRRKIIEENLRFAYPEKTEQQRRELARGMWRHIFLLIAEVVNFHRKVHRTNWRDYVQLSEPDMREFANYVFGPRPLVLVAGHFGNFEIGGVILGLLGYKTFSVARPFDNRFLHRFMTQFREATGQYMLPKQGSSPQLDAVLRDGGTISLLGDQYAGPRGCWVQFFDRPASCHKAVGLFSLTAEAPMLLAYAKRTKTLHFEGGFVDRFDPQSDEVVSVKELTQRYSKKLEEVIRTAPEQYWWLHRRWKDTRPPRKQKSKRSAA